MKGMRRKERGIVAVVVAIAMLILLLVAGFAIDIGHLALNKSRLQSTVDASALAAAKVLADSQSVEAADLAAREMFDLNAAKHRELREVLSGDAITVQFSNTLNPFVPGTTPPEYVRVIARGFSMWTSFTVLIGLDEMTTRASAVAGPMPSCEMWPVGVCAQPGSSAPSWGRVPYGQDGNTVTLLKWSATGTPPLGESNFQLLALPGGLGKRDLRQYLRAGAACVDLGGQVETEPGNATSIREGVNSRFYPPTRQRQLTYLPDMVAQPNDPASLPLASPDGITITSTDGQTTRTVTSIGDVAFSYVDYLADYAANRYQYPYPEGRAHRRIVTVPVIRAGECGDTHGRKTVDVVGYARYLLLQPVCLPKYCAPGTEGWVFAQYLDEGDVSGAGHFGPYRIVLHNDPDSPDS
jgi:hypothetical protein